MATWTVNITASGSAHDMTVDTTNHTLRFAGNSFADTIAVGSYQQTMHVQNADASDECGNHPTNVIDNLAFVDGSNAYHRGTTGSGSIVLRALGCNDKSCIKFSFTHDVAVSTSGASFYVYDGSVLANPAAGVAAWAVEPPDTEWTSVSGSAQALSLTDQGSATSHDFYIGVACGPTSVGTKSGWKMRLAITYY